MFKNIMYQGWDFKTLLLRTPKKNIFFLFLWPMPRMSLFSSNQNMKNQKCFDYHIIKEKTLQSTLSTINHKLKVIIY